MIIYSSTNASLVQSFDEFLYVLMGIYHRTDNIRLFHLTLVSNLGRGRLTDLGVHGYSTCWYSNIL